MALVVLIGMMGSGKSTVGMALARQLNVPFFDTDKLLEHHLGRPIKQWFQIYGEQAFREHETLMLKSLDEQEGVLATGGGIILREENWEILKEKGIIVFLDVHPDVLKERLTNTKRKRPLLEVENWEQRFDEIYSQRKAIYQKADFIIEVHSEELEEVALKIKETLVGSCS